MELPNREKAYIPIAKLRNYLLSETHITGKSKSKFFRMLGFNKSNLDLLEKNLKTIAMNQNVVEVHLSSYGKKYIIDGNLVGPNKNSAKIRTIWIIEKDLDVPRFVTAYPKRQ